MSLRVLSAALAGGICLAGVVVCAAPASAVDPTGPVQVAIAVPITVPENSGALIPADALIQYTSPLGTLTRQLDAVVDRPVALGIDPRIIVSIRILGSSAPVGASAWLQRLSDASNETFPLAYADSDMTLATQAGSIAVLEPDGFDFAIDPELFRESGATTEPTATSTSSPSLAPTSTTTSTPVAPPVAPEVPALPTSADLLSWPYSLTGIAWPVDATAVVSDLPAITSSGYTTTILTSGNLNSVAGAGAIADVDGARVLVSQDSVAAPFRTAARASNTADWQAAVDQLSVAIADTALAQSGTTATVFATLDREPLRSGDRVSDTITSLQSNPNIRMVGLGAALATTASTATVVDTPQAAERIALMRQLLEAQAAEVQFAGIAEDPIAITAARRLELLAISASGWSNNPSGWPVAVEDNLAASRELRRSVQVASTGDFNFLAASAPLPIAVTNDLDQPVTVFVTVRPDTGLLSVGESRVELTIEPNSQASARIPVQAVSNGVVGVTITLASSTGVAIGETSRASINVQAGWETPVVIVIASLVVAVFGAGLIRNIVRLRRAAAAKGSGL
ncbi:MAG: hypothetical protein H7226_14660 [Salinibacterium sp.]|nr:hypothetical protein [Salinibacterium sp.]